MKKSLDSPTAAMGAYRARSVALGSLLLAGLAFAGACDHSYPGAGSPGARRSSPFDPRTAPDVTLHYRAGTRLKPRWHVTQDGARELIGVRDTQLGIDCIFLPTSDGLRCVPDPSADGALTDEGASFRDASCREQAAWGFGAAEPKFIVAHRYLETDCPEAERRVYRAENARRVTTLYHRYASETCGGKTSISDGISTATRGVDITAMLVRGRRFVVGDGSRDSGGLAFAYIEADDGAVVFDSLVDPTLDAPCSFAVAADGAVRCLPHGAHTTFFFDHTCTSPGATTRCAPPRFIVESDAKCSERTHVLRVGASRPGSYWLKSDIDCIQQSINSTGTTTYAAAAEIAPAQLTAATSVKDASNRRLRANAVAVGSYRALSASASAPWRDSKLDVDCRFAPAADGGERCLPWTSAVYVDAARR